MLKSIHVENMALIDQADAVFTDQLNILTGETGAGKSIVIGSVSMALGGKASRDMIRTGADYALSELDFEVEDRNRDILKMLDEQGIPAPDDHIIITRRITGGRSIARINGEMVSLSVLKTVASRLIDIHGQHEHQSLLHTENHIRILDRFAHAQLDGIRDEVHRLYREYTALKKEMDSAVTDEAQRKSQISYLEYQVNEIDAANLREGEEEELDRHFRKMNSAKTLLESCAQTHAMTGYEDGNSAGGQIGRALHELQAAQRYDDSLEGLISQLSDIDGLLNDFNRELADYETSLVFDDETYREVEARLETISDLKSKYGGSEKEILAHRDECAAELEKLEGYDEYLARLRKGYDEAVTRLTDASDSLSALRRQAAEELEEKITSALRDLNFLDVRFEIRCEKQEQFCENGRDKVEFLISANPGEALRPLSKVASGGELSRIMLAIKSVLADTDDIPTLIFDEIDTGISGRTAQMVSEKMALIARSHQVICITHLPQIASMADSHYLIEKKTDGGRTRTQIRHLDEDDAVREVARLLGGVQITDTVLKNAAEMRQMASEVKSEMERAK